MHLFYFRLFFILVSFSLFMADNIYIKDIMSRHLVSCSPDMGVREIAGLMKENSVGTVLVLDGNELVGIVSERDIINKVVCSGKEGFIARDIMTSNVVMGNVDMTFEDVVVMLSDKGIKKLPILDGDKVVGIITQTDILKASSIKWAL